MSLRLVDAKVRGTPPQFIELMFNSIRKLLLGIIEAPDKCGQCGLIRLFPATQAALAHRALLVNSSFLTITSAIMLH